MSVRRTRATLAAATLTTVVAVGLAAPASATAPAPAAAGTVSAVQVTGDLSGRDPFPKLSPAAIEAKAVKAAKAAKTVHVRATFNDGTQVVKVDAVIARTTAKARIVMSKRGTVDVVRHGEPLFLRGDAKFWAAVAQANPQAAAVAPKLVGKWIQFAGTAPQTKQMCEFITIGTWIDGLSAFHATKRIPGRAIGGKPTVGLIDEVGKDGSVMYVAVTGTPYPLFLGSNDKTASLTFLEWNKAVRIAKPKPVAVLPI